MYNERIENLINAALADGELTEKEKQILFKNAQDQGIDLDEFEMVLEARLTELEKVKKEAAPKSNKYGDVRKCPACGSLVPAFKGVCQECGFEFTNVDANLSSKQLADKLLNEESEKRKIEIIETFPIPTSKADLLEFLTSLKPRLQGVHNQYTEVYLKKYKECIEKAKIAFEGDKQLQGFIDGFPELEKRIKSMKFKSGSGKTIAWIWEHKISVIIIAVVIVAAISSLIDNIASGNKEKDKSALVESFNSALEEGDLTKAQSDLEEFYKNHIADYNDERTCGSLACKLVEIYLAKNNLEKAESICSITDTKYYCEKTIYKWLVDNEQFDKAWEYKSAYDNPNTIYNAEEYYEYMSDVVFCLCKKNKKNEARTFVNKYAIWFKQNVDNSTEKGSFSEKKENEKEKYKDYYYSVAKNKLLKIINEY